MSLNSSQKNVISNSNSNSKSKSKTSSEKKLSLTAYNDVHEIKNSKFKSKNFLSKNVNNPINNSNHRPNTTSVDSNSTKSKSKLLSPANRMQPNSSKSQYMSVLSCTSKNSKMSPIDINELGSDEKDDIINNKK